MIEICIYLAQLQLFPVLAFLKSFTIQELWKQIILFVLLPFVLMQLLFVQISSSSSSFHVQKPFLCHLTLSLFQ
jgi:hypothetical protein